MFCFFRSSEDEGHSRIYQVKQVWSLRVVDFSLRVTDDQPWTDCCGFFWKKRRFKVSEENKMWWMQKSGENCKKNKTFHWWFTQVQRLRKTSSYKAASLRQFAVIKFASRNFTDQNWLNVFCAQVLLQIQEQKKQKASTTFLNYVPSKSSERIQLHISCVPDKYPRGKKWQQVLLRALLKLLVMRAATGS